MINTKNLNYRKVVHRSEFKAGLRFNKKWNKKDDFSEEDCKIAMRRDPKIEIETKRKKS